MQTFFNYFMWQTQKGEKYTFDLNLKNLSLSECERKFILLHKKIHSYSLPLKFPQLLISKKEIKRVSSIKFLGVIFDKHLSLNEHIKLSGSDGVQRRQELSMNRKGGKSILKFMFKLIPTKRT